MLRKQEKAHTKTTKATNKPGITDKYAVNKQNCLSSLHRDRERYTIRELKVEGRNDLYGC